MPTLAALEAQLSRLAQLLTGESTGAIGTPEAAEAALARVNAAIAAGAAGQAGPGGSSLLDEEIVGVGGLSQIILTVPTGTPTLRALRVRLYARTNEAADRTNIALRINGDTGLNYNWIGSIIVGGTTLTGGEQYSAGQAAFGPVCASLAPANRFGAFEVTILRPSDIIGHKPMFSSGSYSVGDGASQQAVTAGAAVWRSTAAVASVTLIPVAGSFVQGTVATLLGDV